MASACAALGLCLIGFAMVTPLAAVSMQGGRFAATDLFTGPELLHRAGTLELAIVVVFTLVLFPVVKLASVVGMALGLELGRVPLWLKRAFNATPILSSWAMVDVFLLGAMIALVRLGAWMQVDFGPALFALGGVALCSLGADRTLDRQYFWSRAPHTPARAATNANLIGCSGCGYVVATREGEPCPRCNQSLRRRKPNSINRTWALIIAAALLAIPANVLPVMTINKFGEGGASTILGGTVELLERGFWPLAVLVFTASILVPLLKLGALAALLITTARASAAHLEVRTKLFRVVAMIGRWSMLDIFATMMLVALARFAWVGSVLPENGATAFCAVVLLTMLASEAFDPRLMWDAAGRNSVALATTSTARGLA